MAEVNRHYDVTHHWGTPPYDEDDQAEMWLSWDTKITFPNDLEYIDVEVYNVNWTTRKGNMQPWSQHGMTQALIDSYVLGFCAPGAQPIYVWPDCYAINWVDNTSPIYEPGTETESFSGCTEQYKTVYPELRDDSIMIEGSYMRTDAVYAQFSFPHGEYHQYSAGQHDTWTFTWHYKHRFNTNGVLPNPLNLFRFFMRYKYGVVEDAATHFFDGIIQEPFPPADQPYISKYFPWAIRKPHEGHMLWESCNRYSEAEPDRRAGQLEIRNDLAGQDNVLNDYINENEQLGYHYRNGQWERAPLNGWWSGPDLPWDGVNEAPPIGVQMAMYLSQSTPKIIGYSDELATEIGEMKVSSKTTSVIF